MNGNLGGTAQERIERLAYALWEARGRPLGSPDQDWFAAEASIRGQQSAKTLPRSESNARQSHGASRWKRIVIAIAAVGAVSFIWWLHKSRQ